MKKLNPEYVTAVKGVVNASPYFQLLSMEIVTFGAGESHLEIHLDKKHLQPFRMVHGGVFSSLVDAAAFWACYPLVQGDAGLTTVEMKLNYLAPINGGKMIGRGKSIKMGKNLCLGETTLFDAEGKILAHGTATMMIISGLALEGSAGFPPKHL